MIRYKFMESLDNPGEAINGQILKIDGDIESVVPESEINSDWREYQEWLAEPNTPEAFDA